jgi:hypothetical protein
MSTLVTLQQAKDYLGQVLPALHPSEGVIQMALDASENLILAYVSPYPEDAQIVAGWTPETAPPIVPQSILFTTGEFFRWRGDDVEGAGPRRREFATLHPLIEGALQHLRTPVIA